MNYEDQLNRALDLLVQAKQAIALTGAGISTPSGIPDFRSPESGIWHQVDPLDVASIYAFRVRPQTFFDWVHPLAKVTVEAQPNVAHFALAQLEKYGPLRGVITQNIDMLHTKAGSETVYEVHGHWREATCLRCYTIYPSEPYLDEFIKSGCVPYCPACEGVLKPNVILFGEQLPVRVLNEARKWSRTCDLMLVVGSSLQTAPAGDLPMLAAESGARLIIVNREPTIADYLADVVIHADVVDVLPKLAAPFVNQ